jgi:hypothetical protein
MALSPIVTVGGEITGWQCAGYYSGCEENPQWSEPVSLTAVGLSGVDWQLTNPAGHSWSSGRRVKPWKAQGWQTGGAFASAASSSSA